MTNVPTDSDAPSAAVDDCAHVYASEHKPYHRIYWLRYCMLCGKPDWDEVDRQVDEVVAEATARERQAIAAAIDAEAGRMGYDVTEVYDVAWPHLAGFVADLLHA